MNRILSQDDVDALLNGLSNASTLYNNDSEDTKDNVVSFDLRNRDRFIRGRFPVLEIINDKFARLCSNKLNRLINKNVKINPISIDVTKFGEFARSIPTPTILDVNEMRSLHGKYLLVLDSRLVFSFIEASLGHKNSQPKIEGREFTKIESNLIQHILDDIVECKEDAWYDLIDINSQRISTEINPQFAGIASFSELVITTTFEVEIENAIGSMIVCIPYSTIEPIKDKLYSCIFVENAEYRKTEYIKNTLDTIINSLPLELRIEATIEISIDTLSSLKVGDTLYLDTVNINTQKHGTVVDIPTQVFKLALNGYIRNKLKLIGYLEKCNGKNCIKVTKNMSVTSNSVDATSIIHTRKTYIKQINRLIKKLKLTIFNFKYKIFKMCNIKYFEYFNKIDHKCIARYLRFEHPQTIATILFFLNSVHAAEILGQLPEGMRAEILMRITDICFVQETTLKYIDAYLRKNLKTIIKCDIFNTDSIQARRIINRISNKDNILEEIEQDCAITYKKLTGEQ